MPGKLLYIGFAHGILFAISELEKRLFFAEDKVRVPREKGPNVKKANWNKFIPLIHPLTGLYRI